MNKQATRILLAVLWLASIAAAYFVGQSATSPTPDGTAASKSSTQENNSSNGGAERRAGMVEPDDGRGLFGADGEKKSIQLIVARARAEAASGMGGMMNLRGMLRAIAPLAELDDKQIQEALVEVEKSVKEPQQRMMFYSILLGQWAETDGAAAMAYAEEKLQNKSPFDFGVRGAVLGAWAKSNPDAVWKWYQSEKDKLSGEQNMQMVHAAVFGGMAANDLDLALSRLASLPEGQERNVAANGVSNIAWDERGRRRLLDRLDGVPADVRGQMQQAIVRNWAMTEPEAALAWVRSRPGEEQQGLRQTAGQMVMMTDPERGAELLMEGVEEKDKPRTYDSIVGQWAYRDARKAGEWLMKQPQGPELDGARRTFATIVAQRDAPAAMDWAKSVTDADQRWQSIQQVYASWKQRDGAAADAALDGSGLDAEKIAQIRAAIPGKVNSTEVRR